jgi:hypothetical protein
MTKNRVAALTFVVILFVGVTVGALFWFGYWNTESQRLYRGCQALTIDRMVAPSTTKFIGFRLLRANEQTLHIVRLQQAVAKAEADVKKVAHAKQQAEENNKLADAMSKSVIKRGNVGEMESNLAQMQKNLDTYIDVLKLEATAKTELDQATKALDDGKAENRGEIIVDLDSQNRSAAMIRIHAYCSFVDKPNDIRSEVATSRIEAIDDGVQTTPQNVAM